MFNLGMGEIVVILLLALIFLGPKRLPELASGLGKMIREVRKATSDLKNEIELDETIRKPLEELREATMLPPEELKRRDRERQEREREEKLRQAQPQADATADPAATEEYDPDAQPGPNDVEKSPFPGMAETAAPPSDALTVERTWRPWEATPPDQPAETKHPSVTPPAGSDVLGPDPDAASGGRKV